MSNSGNLQEQEALQQWGDIDEKPVTGSVPRAVPLINLISYPKEDEYNYKVAIGTGLSSTLSIMQIYQLDYLIEIIDKHISYIYPLRSTTRGLEEALKKTNPPQTKINPIATSMLKKLMNNFKTIKQHCDETISQISAVFHQQDFWFNGYYSDVFLDKLFYLIYRLISLGKLCPTRSALSDDISTLHKLIKPVDNSLVPMETRMWMNTPNAIKMSLLDQLSNLPYSLVLHIFNIFIRRITELLNEERFIYPNMETAAIISLLFIIDFFTKMQQKEKSDASAKKKVLREIPKTVIPLITKERAKHPALVLVFEFGVDFDQFITVATDITQKLGGKPRLNVNLFSTLNELSECFTSVSQVISRITANDTPSKETVDRIITLLPKAFRLIGNSIHLLTEFVIDKHDHAPPAPTTTESEEEGNTNNKMPMSKYELAMRYGLSDDERENIMQILALCRAFREMLTSDLPRLNSIISNYIQEEIQIFVKNELESALIKLKTKMKDNTLSNELEKLRATMGYFKSDDEMVLKIRNKETPPLVTYEAHSPPHISLLQLLRSQLQMIINPESSIMSKGIFFSSLDKATIESFTKFVKQSEFYYDLLQLEKTLNIVSDQSSLFFKEFFLDMYRKSSEMKSHAKSETAVHFPITTSLPYVLIDYAITHPEKQELIGSLYYPLSIYDDAASKALRYLDSRYLFEEIRAESEICLLTISKMIVDFVFEKLKNFFNQQFIDQYNNQLLKNGFDKIINTNNNDSLRIIRILQQNQLFLLGNHIDIKSIYVSRLNEMFFNNISNNLKIITNYGILGLMIFSKSNSILEEMHKTFVNYGLQLTPFNDIIKTCLAITKPDSFRSKILEYIITHMIRKLIPQFFLHSNPHRLVPPLTGESTISKFLKSHKISIPSTLKQTASFVTVEHFRELFKYIDDASIVIIIQEIKNYIRELFKEFVSIYSETHGKIRRISNVSIATSCHKAYDMFEGAYRSFMYEKQIDELFGVMRSIGNAIAISEMFDYAFCLRRSSSQQISSYIYQINPGNIEEPLNDSFFSTFDINFSEYKKYFNGINVIPNKSEIAPPFMQEIISEIAKICTDKWELFDETSGNLFDFQSYRGFASVWSVLEYVFILKEVYSKESNNENEEENIKKVNRGAFAQFGEGVLICAAAILCVTKQQNLAKMLSIGGRISQMRKTDLAILEEDVMPKFLAVEQLVEEAMSYSTSSIAPTVEAIYGRK
ncbi:Cytoplasmic FMR1-interacting protein [Histomonas meleagridis]|uniref:Cytoplasmic FMR1-interacting protein n=1 Tax=Histomonas meleagridis TaxID=135588 RepID=UPI00355A8921|nr:Cytoplasmic FMR1-interacting protein [Histomonas meleagridis]KAH0801530.1 Cytoplasmic FMR1-interacting protein [Histomonas meleagridis]